MIDEGKEIEVKCHFCNTAYHYSVDELKELLKRADKFLKFCRNGLRMKMIKSGLRNGSAKEKHMRHGFVKVAAATPDIRVADVEFNKENICRGIEEAEKANAKILVFPELCVTGYTCSDLFDHAVLLKAAKKALLEIAEFTRDRDLLVFVGVPLEVDGKLYNVAAALNHGKILGLTTKTFLPNYGEFYEMRQFTPGPEKARYISFNGEEIPFGPQLLFRQQKWKI